MITSKAQLISLLDSIADLLFSTKYAGLNQSNHIAQYNMKMRFDYAHRRLEKLPDKIELNNETYTPFLIRKSWKQFDASFNGTVTEAVKKKYGELIKSTCSFLEYLKSLPAVKSNAPSSYNARSIDVKDEEIKQKRLKDTRSKLKELIKFNQSSPNPDAERIEELQLQLNAMDQEIRKSQERIESVNSDRNAEIQWGERIEQAFKDLGAYTRSIEHEKEKASVEYWIFLIITGLLIIAFCVQYFLFIKDVQQYKILLCTWLDYLPYGLLVPLYSILIGLCIYQKNRANKISIELTTRLFNIHYLEGLMQLANKLSANPNIAINKINHTVDSMLHSYLKLAERNQLSELELCHIENKELESTPYWKLLHEIKQLVKTIRQ